MRLHCSLIIHRGTYAWVLCCWLLCTYVSHRKHSKCLSSPHYIVPNFVFSPIANGLQNSKFIYIRVMWETSFYNRYLLIYYSISPLVLMNILCQLPAGWLPNSCTCALSNAGCNGTTTTNWPAKLVHIPAVICRLTAYTINITAICSGEPLPLPVTGYTIISLSIVSNLPTD